MKVKTADLIGPALDWAVAKCEKFDARNNYRCQLIDSDDIEYVFECYADDDDHAKEQALDFCPNSEVYSIKHIGRYLPSTDWRQGGSIIEREGVSLNLWAEFGWRAGTRTGKLPASFYSGPTPLVAAMRCFVASRFGDEVDIPEELL